jgi:Mn-dependent DtxR family transcriptional regulator
MLTCISLLHNLELITAGSIAKELGVSDAKVKKAIQELIITPAAKKGVCSYYPQNVVSKIKAVLK